MSINKRLKSAICVYKLLFIALLSVLPLLAGCQEPDPYGELQFGLDEGTSKSITPGSSATVTQVHFWGERTNSSKTLSKQTLILGEKNTVSSIPVGTWDFHVEGMNSDGTVITEQADATGVAVNSGKTSSISFTLHYLTSDTGTYSIGISWPDDLGASFKEVGADIGEDYVAGTISNSSVAVSGSAAAGDYMVGVRFTNPSGTQITFSGMDMVNVFTGLESSGTISFEDADFTKAAQPTISTGDVTGGKQVTMATDTAEAAIYYTTDGTDPATSSTRESYTAPFTLAESKTVEAVAVKADLLDSEGASQVVTVSTAVTPTFSLSSGDSQDVAISCKTGGATVHYRYAVGSASYGSWATGTTVPVTQGKELKVEAYAEKDGMVRSATGTQTYSVASGPNFSKTTGTYSNTFTLTLTGDTIRYKVGSGTYQTYSSGISITSAGTTVTAFNEASGEVNSAPVSNTYTLKVATPVISQSDTTGGQEVSIICGTDSATIHYTTDGSTPTASSTTGTSLTLTSGKTVKAIAVKDNFASSEVASKAISISAVTTPTFSLSSGDSQDVAISCKTGGATVHYRYAVGSASYGSWATGTTVPVTQGKELRAQAYATKSGWTTSGTGSADYTVATVPGFNKNSGTYSNTFTLTLTGDTIRYKVGSGTYQTYSSGISITSTGTTVTAFNEEDGKVNSAPVGRTYTLKAATPVISQSATTGGQKVSISCGTSGATIHYTTDGSIPTASSTTGTSLTLTSGKTVKAIAVKDNFASSEVASKTVAVSTVTTPTFSPAGGTTFTSTQTVTMTSTNGATIYYTADGTTPTTSSSHITSGESIPLSATTTIKAMAVKSGMANSSVASATYTLSRVGTKGPAGGYIFYDCDADNTTDDPDGADDLESSVCGWRYLEAAPANESKTYVWGGSGTSVSETSQTIGTGKANTEKIVAKYDAAEKTGYAAKVCSDKTVTMTVANGDKITYDDWFLPSENELYEMYRQRNSIGGFRNKWYWSSSQSSADRAYYVCFSNGGKYDGGKNNGSCVRAVRAFK